MTDITTTEEAIDFILKYNMEYAPRKAIYDYCHRIVLAAEKKEAASGYEKALSELSMSPTFNYQIDSKYETECLSIVDAALKKYPDSRFESATVWLSKVKNTRFPKSNGLQSAAIRCALNLGNVALLKHALDNGYNTSYIVDAKTGQTALMIAAAKGYKNSVKTLIDAKANVNLKDKEGKNALWHAAGNVSADNVNALIAAKADVNVIADSGWSPLMYAARNGRTDSVKALINAKANLEAHDKKGWTALKLAAKYGHAECVKALIAAKANLEYKYCENDYTALGHAAGDGHAECVKALIEAKANLEDKGGLNLDSALWGAACNGHIDCVNLLIAANANIESKNAHGLTPLSTAAYWCRVDCVRALIKAKANVDAKDKDGKTPLHGVITCVYNEEAEMCLKLLIEAGANLNIQNNEGKTPLFKCVDFSSGKESLVKLLIAGNANLEITDEKGKTALIAASQNDSGINYVKLLLAANANSNSKDKDGMTALMYASSQGDVETVKVLLEHKAKLYTQNNKGETALMLASAKGHTEVVQLLKNADTLFQKFCNWLTSCFSTKKNQQIKTASSQKQVVSISGKWQRYFKKSANACNGFGILVCVLAALNAWTTQSGGTAVLTTLACATGIVALWMRIKSYKELSYKIPNTPVANVALTITDLLLILSLSGLTAAPSHEGGALWLSILCYGGLIVFSKKAWFKLTFQGGSNMEPIGHRFPNFIMMIALRLIAISCIAAMAQQ